MDKLFKLIIGFEDLKQFKLDIDKFNFIKSCRKRFLSY